MATNNAPNDARVSRADGCSFTGPHVYGPHTWNVRTVGVEREVCDRHLAAACGTTSVVTVKVKGKGAS